MSTPITIEKDGSLSIDTFNQGIGNSVNGSSQASGALIYVDGVAQTTSVVYNNLTASILNDTKVMIGNRATTYANFNGIIDEVIWEDVVWTPEYIKKYYTYSKGRFGIL